MARRLAPAAASLALLLLACLAAAVWGQKVRARVRAHVHAYWTQSMDRSAPDARLSRVDTSPT